MKVLFETLSDWFNPNAFLSERFILILWQVIPLDDQWKEKIHCSIHQNFGQILVLFLYLINTCCGVFNKLCWRFSYQGKQGGAAVFPAYRSRKESEQLD